MVESELKSISEKNPKNGLQVFSTGEVAAMFGLTLSDVDYWVRSKLIVPSVRDASGHGTRRIFSQNDLKQILLVGHLSRKGTNSVSARLLK